jgi:tyrosyl-tRNA synthetase
MTDKEKIDELLTRGVGEFIDPDGIFRKKLETNPEKIVIKFGIDPTRPDIHIGHAVVLRKLRQFQDLGCRVIFLIGDFTALIGDPTGKSKIRPEVNIEEVQENMKTFLDQVDKILLKDPKVFAWITNSDWIVSINDIVAPVRKLDFKNQTGEVFYTTPEPLPESDIFNKAGWWVDTRMQKNGIRSYTFIRFLAILRHISHGRLLERDMFKERIKKGEPIFMHEMMYPVIQGIDSDAIFDIYGSCDLEVGGTDQHFNMLVGRDVMEMNKKVPQSVLSFKILEGLDGKEKMSKSLDNYIGITDEPNDMYGKVMSIPDSSIENYFELCTDIEKSKIPRSKNPKDDKMKLAFEIVKIYHGEQKAKEAEGNFIAVFQNKEVPEEMTEVALVSGPLMDILVKAGIIASNSEFRRLIKEGAVVNLETDIKISDANFIPEAGQKFKIGKKRFVKIIKK